MVEAKKWVVIGKFGRPHGIKGFINVNSFTEPKENLLQYPSWHCKLGQQWTLVKLKTIEVNGWPTRFGFESLLGKIDKYEKWGLLSNGDIGWRDETGKGTPTSVMFEVVKQRNTQAIFDKMEEAKRQSEDEDAQAAYEAEMSRQDYKQYGDGYQVEETSPCKDPNDNLRFNGKDKSHQSYPSVERTDFYVPNL